MLLLKYGTQSYLSCLDCRKFLCVTLDYEIELMIGMIAFFLIHLILPHVLGPMWRPSYISLDSPCEMSIEKDFLCIWQSIYATMPRNLAMSPCSFGILNSTIGFTLAGSGFNPFAVSQSPRNVNSSRTIWHFSLFRVTLFDLHMSRTFLTVIWCDFVSLPQITISSIEVSKFSIPWTFAV